MKYLSFALIVMSIVGFPCLTLMVIARDKDHLRIPTAFIEIQAILIILLGICMFVR